MPTEKKQSVADAVRQRATPMVEALGLQLWDVRFLKEGADWILRLIIDKPEGVGIEDCIAVNDALDQPLDAWDLIDRAYRLQVQSPGAERVLVRPEHFRQYLGKPIKLRLRQAVQERKNYAGILQAYQDDTLALLLPDGQILSASVEDTTKIQADDMEDFQ